MSDAQAALDDHLRESPNWRFSAIALASIALATLLPLGIVAVALLEPLHAAAIGKLVMSLVSVAPLSWGLFRLRSCLAEFAGGRPFSRRSIAGLRDFAVGVALSALTRPIAGAVLSVVLSLDAPPGQKHLVLELSSDTLLLGLFAATIAALAWAMQKAAALQEENSRFV